MASKRKKPPVAKATSEQTRQAPTKEANVESLIRRNGNAVEEFLQSEIWRDIVQPLISEGVASVSGRLTNGRYYDGDLTRDSVHSRDYLAGYQKGLMDLNNRLNDFVVERDKLARRKVEEQSAARQPYVNPFLEELDEER